MALLVTIILFNYMDILAVLPTQYVNNDIALGLQYNIF